MAIARNLLIDHHRRNRFALTDQLDERALPTTPGPDEQFAASPDLVAALSQLKGRDREVIALRFGGDLSGPEIAALLDLSLANVQQILSRSLRKLRQMLDNEDPTLTSGTRHPQVRPSA